MHFADPDFTTSSGELAQPCPCGCDSARMCDRLRVSNTPAVFSFVFSSSSARSHLAEGQVTRPNSGGAVTVVLFHSSVLSKRIQANWPCSYIV
jgi:hypothetical protein